MKNTFALSLMIALLLHMFLIFGFKPKPTILPTTVSEYVSDIQLVKKKPPPKKKIIKKKKKKKKVIKKPDPKPPKKEIIEPPKKTEPTYGKIGKSNNPIPKYPSYAVRKGFEGTVILNVEVLPNGSPGRLEVTKPSGHKILDKSAIKAIKKWKFKPATLLGLPVSSWVEIPIEFSLSEGTQF